MAVRVGTRGSKLARTQTAMVAGMLRTQNPTEEFEEIVVATADDEIGDKSRFVSALEQALLDDAIDVAVHSAKDLPGQLADGLTIGAVPERAPAQDLLCGAGGLDELASGARVGTGALRRKAQLLALRPDLRIEQLRGNIDTRLARLVAGDFDAIVLAQAGVRRLGVIDVRAGVLEHLIPAPGQGTLALEVRSADSTTLRLVAAIANEHAATQLAAERAAMAALGADCDTAAGVYATESDGGRLLVRGWAGVPDGSRWVRDHVEGPAGEAAGLGVQLAQRMLSAGGREILDEARSVA